MFEAYTDPGTRQGRGWGSEQNRRTSIGATSRKPPVGRPWLALAHDVGQPAPADRGCAWL